MTGTYKIRYRNLTYNIFIPVGLKLGLILVVTLMNFKFSRHDLPASAVLLLISDQAASRHFTEHLSVRLYDITQIEVLW